MLSLSVLAELQIPKLLQTIIDTGIAGKDLYLIGTTALLIVVLAFIEAGLAIGNTFLSVRAAQGFAAVSKASASVTSTSSRLVSS
jgi:hypothetical protein